MAHEKILAKLRKLRALADNPSATQAEAELALSRLNDIARQHGLSMAEVELSELGEVRQELYEVVGQKMKLKWIEQLAMGCANMFEGKLIVNRQLHGTSFWFVGFEEDIAAMRYMFEHLYKSWFSIVERDLDRAKMLSLMPFQPKDTMKFKAGHGLAYALTICGRVSALVQQRQADISASSNGGRALVVYKGAQVEEFLKEFKTVKSRISSGSQVGQKFGRAAGSAIPLGGGVTAPVAGLIGSK